MADWAHFDGDVRGSNCSQDTVAGPPRQLQWVVTSQRLRGGNAAMYPVTMGWRIVDGLAVTQWRDVHYAWTAKSNNARDHRGPGPEEQLRARSAWNGLPRWKRPLPGARHQYGGVHRWLVVADDRYLYTFAKPGGKAKALDLVTGEELKTFTEGLKLGSRDFRQPVAGLRVLDGILYQYSSSKVVALDVDSGKRRWTWSAEEGERTHGLVLAPDKDAALLLVGPSEEFPKGGPRWPGLQATAVVCLNLKKGTLRWR
jgi:outer membrane protein assembly factor BamB